jgi:hypothetical protein
MPGCLHLLLTPLILISLEIVCGGILASAFAGGFIENSSYAGLSTIFETFLDDGYVMNSNILTIVQPTVTVEILNETIKGPV